MATLKDLEPIVRIHSETLTRIAPMVDNHHLVLYGDPKNRKDEGIVGAINNIEELVVTIRSWVKPVAVSLVSALVFFVIQQIVAIYILLNPVL